MFTLADKASGKLAKNKAPTKVSGMTSKKVTGTPAATLAATIDSMTVPMTKLSGITSSKLPNQIAMPALLCSSFILLKSVAVGTSLPPVRMASIAKLAQACLATAAWSR